MSTLDIGLRRSQRRGGDRWQWWAVDLLLTWRERSRQRRQLQSLNERMLRDIGLTRADVVAEASKPFWRV